MKRFFGLIIGFGVCALTGVWREGLIFLAAELTASLPGPPACRWYDIAIGGLLSGIAVAVAGDNSVLFWGLTDAALTALSLTSLPRTAILAAGGWFMLRSGAGAEIYAPLYIGIIYNSILIFARGEIYGHRVAEERE